MRFTLTAEQQELRSTLRKLLEARSSSADVRREMEAGGFDRDLWRRLAGELGVLGLDVPEAQGGLGMGFADKAVVLEELGRSLAPVPFFSTCVLATHALLASEDASACERWLPSMVAGELVVTLAAAEAGDWDLDRGDTRARRTDDGSWVVTGRKAAVTDAQHADLVLVLASSDEGSVLLAVRPVDDGVDVTPEDALDPTRPLGTVVLDDAPAVQVGAVGGGVDAVRAALERGAIALACEQVGGMDKVLQTAVDYAKMREQFNRPIGSFQAIKHILAERLLDVESARVIARDAAVAVDDDPERVGELAALTKAFCSDAYLAVAGSSIQVHGGIGYTWEHDAHLYFKRATTSRLWLGAPSTHRERLASTFLPVASEVTA